jgi:hypothetical protein
MFLSAILIPARSCRAGSGGLPLQPGELGRGARNAIVTGDDWSATGVYLLLLLAAAAVTSSFATWCFSHQRSLCER